jgi:hypothetical protein
MRGPESRERSGRRSIPRGRDCRIGAGDDSEIPPEKEWKMLKSLLLRYGFLAALVLAAGAGKKWF